MAVAELVHLFESLDQHDPPPHTRRYLHKQSSSNRLRRSLESVLQDPLQSRKSCTITTSTPSSSQLSSPTSSYRSSSSVSSRPLPTFRHSADLTSFFTSPGLTSPSASPMATRRRVRRRPSMIDLALEAERWAVGAETVGLGLLEPRPRVSTPPIPLECSLVNLTNGIQSPPPSMVLDGIFEVMESS